MIIDTALYDTTSKGSAKKILCRCDICGVEKMAIKQKIYNRGGYKICQSCFARQLGKSKAGSFHSEETRLKIKNSRKGLKFKNLTLEEKSNSTRKYVEIMCTSCTILIIKREDSLKEWSGCCKSCRAKEVANRPYIKEISRQNGINIVKKFGGVPNAKHFTSDRARGEANNNWRGGITPETIKIRNSEEMKFWRKSVFERDNYSCLICSKRGGDLQADHIKPFALFPSLRFDIENGRTLCIDCHRKYGARVSRGKITREAMLLENKHRSNAGWIIG